jgi:hypothetical protein
LDALRNDDRRWCAPRTECINSHVCVFRTVAPRRVSAVAATAVRRGRTG